MTKEVLEAILNIRHKNAADFKRSGVAWEAYDEAVLACYHAVEAVLKESKND